MTEAEKIKLPNAIGVSRDAESPGEKSVLISFDRALTDNELRYLHELLAGRIVIAQLEPEIARAALNIKE